MKAKETYFSMVRNRLGGASLGWFCALRISHIDCVLKDSVNATFKPMNMNAK